MIDDPRKKYWDGDYVQYWKARVEETNTAESGKSSLNHGDVLTTSDDDYHLAISLLSLCEKDSVLELGCGFGRSVPPIAAVVKHIHAVDISPKMIDAAESANSAVANATFQVAVGEHLPFPSEMFTVVICFGVFDAMYQALALKEMNRVAAFGARILITGKNDDYRDDDANALVAEDRAREKGHPNFFTDLPKLLENAAQFGFCVEVQRYFVRRGDFHRRQYTEHPTPSFYEYMLVLRKEACFQSPPDEISSPVSRTWRRLRAARSAR